MVYLFFAYHSLVLDEKDTLEVFRGGVFYVRDNFWKIIGLLFFAVFIPMGLTLLFQQSVLNALFGLQSSSTSTTAFQTG